MIYTIDKIAEVIHAQRVGTAFTHVAFLLTDSRSLAFPEETLFFALKTERNDGHRYINDLYYRVGMLILYLSTRDTLLRGTR